MQTYKSRSLASVSLLAVLVAFVFAGAYFSLPGLGSSEVTHEITAPPPPGMQTATFAAGCFWSMQAIFQQLKGVEKVEPGYSGGTSPHPSYGEVETGTTGYAEAVDITFNPKVISYNTLLQVLLTARNPTTLNSQPPDVGTNYRSVIFYHSKGQRLEALSMIKKINDEHFWNNPIVTTVQPYTTFWRAESYHLNYYANHPYVPYCQYVIAPEIARFRALYPKLLQGS